MQTKVRMFGSESWKDACIKASTTAGKTWLCSAFVCKHAESLHILLNGKGWKDDGNVDFLFSFFLSTSQYICIVLFPNTRCPSISSLKQSLLCCFAFKLPKNCSRSSNLKTIIMEKWSKSICQVCKLLNCICSYFLEVTELLMHCYVLISPCMLRYYDSSLSVYCLKEKLDSSSTRFFPRVSQKRWWWRSNI